MTEWLLGRIKLGYLSECRTNSLRTWKKDTADRKGPYQSTRNRMAEVPSSSLDLGSIEDELYRITCLDL